MATRHADAQPALTLHASDRRWPIGTVSGTEMKSSEL